MYYIQKMKNIRVALIARSTLHSVPGGDTVQIKQTAFHLSECGVTADIKLTSDKIYYEQYDLLHFFNITRPADILYHVNKSRKKFVISTIFVDYTEYDKKYRKGLSGLLFRFLSTDANEYIKTVLRSFMQKDKLISFSYLWKGQRKSIKEILQRASMILPNSKSEYKRLFTNFGIACKHTIIPNGVDPDLFNNNNPIARDPHLIICVARIEGIKNQLNLIKALNNTKYQLLLIGSPTPNQSGYYNQCKKIAAHNVIFINNIPQQELLQYYQKASIHILPSRFETTGLSSLEAAVMGCKIIVTDKGDTKEYFGGLAAYCDPNSPENILQTIEQISFQPYNDALRKKIYANYTWHEATAGTSYAYKEVINYYEATHWNFGHPWHSQ